MRMGDGDPRVAVVIPCHNDGALAVEAVDSIVEKEPVTVVVVDDASPDPASRRALTTLDGRPGVTLIWKPENEGLSRARMTGVAATTEPYVFPLDADDLAVTGALGAMADILDAAPAAAVCFGDYLEFGDQELVRAVPEHLDAYRVAFTNEYPPSALFRRTVLLETGGWSLDGLGYEDWDLWMTLAERGERGRHAGAGVATYRRRLHGRRMLYTTKRHHVEYYRILRDRHPSLFGELTTHRRATDLSATRRIAYPYVYGGRPRFRFEPVVKSALDRLHFWTLRR